MTTAHLPALPNSVKQKIKNTSATKKAAPCGCRFFGRHHHDVISSPVPISSCLPKTPYMIWLPQKDSPHGIRHIKP